MKRTRVLAPASVVLVALCINFAASAATVTLQPAQTGGTGHHLVVPIVVDPADGVTAMDFLFDYDPVVLEATGVYLTSYTDGFSLTSDLATPGEVSVSLSAGGPLAGKGEVAWVVFRVLGASGTSSALSWMGCELNGGSIASTCVDGSISVVTADAVMSVPDGLHQGPGTTLTVPISLVPATGAEGIDIVLKYNPTILTATAVNKTTLTSAMTLTYNVGIPGSVNISLFGSQALSGSGPLVEVVFSVIGIAGEETPLNLTKGSVNEGAISTTLDDAVFRICDDVDRDGDTITECAGDCEPDDGDVYPGAPEICDGKDNDCDGLVDDEDPDVVADTWYPDEDGDGYGTLAGAITACSPPAPPPEWRLVDGDCDDTDAGINPGATDDPGDDVDENCSGFVACYADADSDGYGDGASSGESSFTATAGVADIPGACGSSVADTWDDDGSDCNDASAGTNPGGTDLAGNDLGSSPATPTPTPTGTVTGRAPVRARSRRLPGWRTRPVRAGPAAPIPGTTTAATATTRVRPSTQGSPSSAMRSMMTATRRWMRASCWARPARWGLAPARLPV